MSNNPFAMSVHPVVLRSEARKARKEREDAKTPVERIVEILRPFSEDKQNAILHSVLRTLCETPKDE